MASTATTPHPETVPGTSAATVAEKVTIQGEVQEKEKIDDEGIQSPQSDEQTQAPDAVPDEERYISGRKLFFVFMGMLLSILLVALDQTIVSTAIPRIASQFNDLSQVTWIASAYFLTQAGFILTYGQILTVAPTKFVYLAAIAIFELGSLICGVAPSMNVLIFGRAFAGVGAAGIFTSCLAIIAQITRLEQRPLLFGSFGAVFAFASVVGPLLGGVFTDHVSWRWCFYINLPIGAITIVTVSFIIKARHSVSTQSLQNLPTWKKWLKLDWIGTTLCVLMVTSILLPLQWGGNTKAWKDKDVIALFCVFAVLLPLWLVWEWYKGETAILPLTMFKRRTQVGTCLEAFFLMLCLLLGAYYLPLFYQSKGHSATKSGIDILPFMLSIVIGAGITGGIINYTGRYWYFLVCSPLIASVGSGLLYTIDINTSSARLIGYQIIFGCGVGGALQNTIIAIQAEYNDEEHKIPQSTSLTNFTQLTGGIIGIAVAGTIFANQLRAQIPIYSPGLSEADTEAVRQSVTMIFTLPEDMQAGVIRAYCRALGHVFLLGIPSGFVASLSGLLVKNYNLKAMGVKMGGGAA